MAEATAHGHAAHAAGDHRSPAMPAAHADTHQEHPIKLYLVVWGWLFILSAGSYLVDYVGLQGYLRWGLILAFMVLKAGLIVAIFMHMAWERLAFIYAILTPEVPTQDVAFLVIRLFSNPEGREEAWRFLRRKWAPLRKRVPPLMISRMIEATPALRTPRHAREVREFFRDHPVPEAARAIRQASERFRLNAELRRRTAGPLATWLSRRSG